MHEKHEEEEAKIREETRRILQIPQLPICVTSVRIPVERAHSISLYIEVEEQLPADMAIELLKKMPGVEISEHATPLRATRKDELLISRIRNPDGDLHKLELWMVGDQLLKGAALNAFQIALSYYKTLMFV